jgi:TIR domain-containing protein
MGFQWACFLSYRHSNADGLAVVDAFHDKLERELGMRGLQVYRDNRNDAGTLYNSLIATTLCESVCMVMMYWPEYFSLEHPYCTREYLAMVRLEEKRRAMLPDAERNFGLIIPVMIRFWRDDLPDDLKNRHHEDFTALSLSPHMRKSVQFARRVHRIAEYIQGRCRAFNAVAHDPCAGRRDFALPSDDEARGWLARIPRSIRWIHDGGPR